jgi:type IV secretion system protein VirB5
MIAQNLELDEQTKQLIEQVATLKQQLDALTNGLDLSALNIGEDFLKDILPPDMRNILSAVKTGDMTQITGNGSHGSLDAGKITGLLNDFYEGVGLDQATVTTLSDSEKTDVARIGTGAQTAAGLSIAAEASAEEASEGLERVDALVRKIPQTTNLKQAIDLNTRVTAELAIAMANMWSMEAAQTISLGQMGVVDAATLADDAKFLDLSGGQ